MSFTQRVALIVSLFIAAPGIARADLITDWNAVAYDLMRMANVDGAPAARALAIMHVSQADAVNTIQNRHTRYAYQGKLQPDASSEAAAASAARNALLALFPVQRPRIEEVYAGNLRAVPDGPMKMAGETVGAEAAAAVIANRADDKTTVPDIYRPVTTAGVWIPTTPPITAQYAQAKPWGFDRSDKFRPGPPPPLTSAEYGRDYNETKTLGEREVPSERQSKRKRSNSGRSQISAWLGIKPPGNWPRRDGWNLPSVQGCLPC